MKTTYITKSELQILHHGISPFDSHLALHEAQTKALHLLEDIERRRTFVEWDGELPLVVGLDVRQSLTRRLLRVLATPIGVLVDFARHVASFRRVRARKVQ